MKYCLEIIVEPTNKATIVLFPGLLFQAFNTEYRSGCSSLIVLDETIRLSFMGIEFKPFSPFFEAFTEQIDWMIAAGLTQLWYSNLINPKNLKRTEEEIGPQILTMEHLAVAFKVCLAPLILSVFVFAVEVSITRIKVVLRKHF